MNPIHFEFANNMLLAEAKGELLFENIVDHYNVLFSTSEFFVGIPAIYDFTHVKKVTGNLRYFEQMANEMGDSNIIDKTSYVAIIVSAENQSMNNIFNAYRQMMDYTLMQVEIFHEKEQALAWLTMNHQVK